MKRILFCACLFLAAQAGFACSLAVHDWQLRFCLDFTPGFTILPLSEIDVLHDRIASGSIREVAWVSDHNAFSLLATIFIPLLRGEHEQASWTPVPSGLSVLELAGKGRSTCAILGSDQHSLKIALFSDKNSLNRCHQLILYETKRIRAIHPHPDTPWAHETIGQAWISLIFYRYPVPGSILSLSAAPVHKEVAEMLTNLPFIKFLVSEKILKRRPGSEYTPESKQIPVIPE